MATSSFYRNDVPLAVLLEWYNIRDTFFGDNFVSQNIPLALHLAASRQHPDACWLTTVCIGKDLKTFEDAKRVFVALGQNDARALCLLWCLFDEDEQEHSTLLRRAADLGFAFAQAEMAKKTNGKERFRIAGLAAAQGERDGFYVLGNCFRVGNGCDQDLEKAKQNLLLASNQSSVWAMIELGRLLDESDPQRWQWWGCAAARGASFHFLGDFVKQVERLNSGSGCAAVVFAIGQALRGHVNEEAGTIFARMVDFNSFFGPAKQAIAFYEAQIKACRKAVDFWTLAGIRLKVVKDIRKVIAKLIWDAN